MELSEIPLLPVASDLNPDVRALRAAAPRLLHAIMEKGDAFSSVEALAMLGPESVVPTEGGRLSACYYLRSGAGYVLKMRRTGVEAEAEALRAWRQAGADTPEVIATGVVPATQGEQEPVKFLLMKAVTDNGGGLGQVAADYVKANPDAARSLGQAMAGALRRMHSAFTARSFGEYGDMSGCDDQFPSWNAYLAEFVARKRDLLSALDVGKERIAALQARAARMDFPATGVYLHADFSARNVLVDRPQPLHIVVIDPNPLVGHPSWDWAVLYNVAEFAGRSQALSPCEVHEEAWWRAAELLAGFREGYWAEHSLSAADEAALALAQLLQCTFLLQNEQRKLAERRNQLPTQRARIALAVAVRRETLLSRLDLLGL